MASAPVTVDEFSRMIGLLYDASLDPQQWQPALMRIRDLFRANYATLILRPPSAEDLGLLIVASETAVEYYFPDYLASPFTGIPCDEVVTVEDILSVSEWRHHAYYQTWCAPHHVFHVLAVDIRTPDHAVFPFRITRAEAGAPFTQEDRERLKQLLPHLRRALYFSTQLDCSESLRALYVQALGLLAVATITLDKGGRILQMNSTAEQLLKAGDGLKLSGGHLEAHYPADNRILQAAIRKSVARLDPVKPKVNETLSVTRPSGKVALGLVLQCVPVQDWAGGDDQPAALLFVRDAESRTQAPNSVIGQMFSLTPAETALAVELANGSSLEEASETLGIRRNTAGAHLRAIFSKTGVRRQTELVRIVLNSVVALGQAAGRSP